MEYKELKIRKGTVLLTQAYTKANGDVLPVGSKICFDVTIAKRMIEAGTAVAYTGQDIRQAAMDSEHGIRSKGKESRQSAVGAHGRALQQADELPKPKQRKKNR